ncbi:MAG: alpha/beta hydrolase [Actinomycetota bacterium]|nr:alpha/beta hydrolase [Actinomycetota bacterium]
MSVHRDLGLVYRFEKGTLTWTLVLLHGTGGDENDLIPLGRYLSPEANLLSPRGSVLEDGMPRFFRRLAMGVFDVDDLTQRTHELGAFIERAIEEFGLDPRHVVAVGYSNGANIAASTLLLRPGLFRAAVLLHAMVPLIPDDEVELRGTSVFITGGRRDSMVPADQTERLATTLSDAGADVEFRLLPGGHQLTQAEAAMAQEWLSRLFGRDTRAS